MKDKLFYIILSIFMFYMTYQIVLIRVFPMKGVIANFSSPYLYIPSGILFLIVGIIFLYLAFKIKEPKEKITKCPKCKEVFNYNELKDGKCKYCKDVDTIDIEEYFKQYPNEL